MSASEILTVAVLTVTVAALPVATCTARQSAEPSAPQAGTTAEGQVAGKSDQTTDTSITVTLDELRQLLARKETPRVELTTTYSKLTGVALKIEKRTISVDVTGEQVAVAGVMGLPLSRVRAVKVLVSLTDTQRREADEASKAYLAGVAAAAKVETPTGETAAAQEPGAETEESGPPEPGEEETIDLLALYPPNEGWGPEKVAEIERKRVVLGLQAFGKDKTFFRDYDAWVKAYNEKRDEQLKTKAAYEDAGTPLPQDFEVLPELAPVPSLEGESWGPNEGVPPGDNHVEPLPEEQWK
ncbi:MAG: hypothetical protein ACYTAN_03865 [Planctomycetota bacterium]|jgi:hypothetical protein